MKPYTLDWKKSQKPDLTEIDINQWREIVMTHARAEDNWGPIINTNKWDEKSVADRGYIGGQKADKAKYTNELLTYIATYAPVSLFNEITLRSKCLEDIWNVIRQWANLHAPSSKHLVYYRLKQAYDPNGNLSPQEYYYNLRDAMESSLIKTGSNISFKGVEVNEDLGAITEATVIIDWLHALGKNALVEHVFRTYAQDLETKSIKDIFDRISLNLPSLMAQAQNDATIKRAFVRQPRKDQWRNRRESSGSRSPPQEGKGRGAGARPRRAPRPATPGPKKGRQPCSLCEAKKYPQANTHTIATCWGLKDGERREIAKIHRVTSQEPEEEDEGESSEYQDGEFEDEEDEDQY